MVVLVVVVEVHMVLGLLLQFLVLPILVVEAEQLHILLHQTEVAVAQVQ
jgi:hypothetical protein